MAFQTSENSLTDSRFNHLETSQMIKTIRIIFASLNFQENSPHDHTCFSHDKKLEKESNKNENGLCRIGFLEIF